MKYRKSEAKEYAREKLQGLWGATLTPFTTDLALDEAGFRRNLRHWFDRLGLDGIFVSGKRGEASSLSIAERKRTFELAVEEANGRVGTIVSCSDMNVATTLELLRHAEAIGADLAVVQAPVLYFGAATEETLFHYYRYVCDQVEIGIALWNNTDHGWTMSPELCARLAELPNVVAIKDSVPREQYATLTRLAGDRLVVSNPYEDEWLDNIVELGWQVLLATPDAFLLQTAEDRRLREYTELARRGEVARARSVRDSLEPVREAFRSAPAGKWAAHMKYWLELQGLVGGPVRPPLLSLTDDEKGRVREAYARSGLGQAVAASA